MPSLREIIIEKLSTSEGQLAITIVFGALFQWIRVTFRPVWNKKYRRQTRGRRASDRQG